MNAHYFQVETVERINTFYVCFGVAALVVLVCACIPPLVALVRKKSVLESFYASGLVGVLLLYPAMVVGVLASNAYGSQLVSDPSLSLMTEQVDEDSMPSLWNQKTRDEINDLYGYEWQTVRKDGDEEVFIFKDPDGALVPCELNLMNFDSDEVAYKAVFTCQEPVFALDPKSK